MKLPQPRYTVSDNDGSHKYFITTPAGETVGPLDSCTGILNIIDKPALKGWAAREAAGYFKAEILRLGAKALTAPELDRIAKEAASAHTRKAKDAADIGTLLHDVFESIILGKELPKFAPELAPAVTAFKNYRLQSDIEVVCTELPVGSLTHRVGGRLDWIGYSESRGGWGIGDNKTSSGFYGNEYAFQAGGGYALMVQEQYGIKISWAEIARFSKKAPYESEARPVTDIQASIDGFLQALALTRSSKLKLIGAPLFACAGEVAPKDETKPAKKGKTTVGAGF